MLNDSLQIQSIYLEEAGHIEPKSIRAISILNCTIMRNVLKC